MVLLFASEARFSFLQEGKLTFLVIVALETILYQLITSIDVTLYVSSYDVPVLPVSLFVKWN